MRESRQEIKYLIIMTFVFVYTTFSPSLLSSVVEFVLELDEEVCSPNVTITPLPEEGVVVKPDVGVVT